MVRVSIPGIAHRLRRSNGWCSHSRYGPLTVVPPLSAYRRLESEWFAGIVSLEVGAVPEAEPGHFPGYVSRRPADIEEPEGLAVVPASGSIVLADCP